MRVIFEKVDLDTCLTALILNVSAEDQLIPVRGGADSRDLQDPSILCIEVGGSGRAELGNFDHHNCDPPLPPACRQAYDLSDKKGPMLARLVQYVSLLDEGRTMPFPIAFPSLSNIFSGMLLHEKNPLDRFTQGLSMLQTVLDEGLDPFQTLPDKPRWIPYKEAKLANQRALATMLREARFHKTHSGRTLAYCEHEAIGGLGHFYRQGCELVVLFNPRFGDRALRKFTVAGNGVCVKPAQVRLNELEPGWGGTETIIGSPRTGSILDPGQVVEIVCEEL